MFISVQEEKKLDVFSSSVEQRELRQYLFKEGSVAFGANTVVAGKRELAMGGGVVLMLVIRTTLAEKK